MSDTTDCPVIEAELLTPVVSLSVGGPIAELSEWAIEPIHGGAGDTLGVYRVAGEVTKDGTAAPWSVILKVIGRPERGGELVDWNYWRREALFYQSDLVAALPRGLERPHCLGVAARPGDQLWLWLEDIDERIAEWTLDDYGRVAYRVAGFKTLPISVGNRSPMSGGSAERMAARQDRRRGQCRRLAAHRGAKPDGAASVPPDVSDWILQTWAHRERYLRILDRLPQTLCHADVFRRNVLIQRHRDSFVLIDWAFIGEGAIGEEFAPLIQGSLLFFEVELNAAHEPRSK